MKRVCLIYPKRQWLYDFESPFVNQGYGLDDPIDGGKILPGFTFQLADIA